MTFHLRECAGQPLMTRGLDVFRKQIEKWKHALDDRDFPGDYAPAVPE